MSEYNLFLLFLILYLCIKKQTIMYGKLGVIKRNKEGLLKCHLCGGFFIRLGSHSFQKHGIKALDYKQQFGLDLTKGLCSEDSKELSRQRVKENYDLVVTQNLIKNGSQTRYEKGAKGRTKEKVSEQTHLRLQGHIKIVTINIKT